MAVPVVDAGDVEAAIAAVLDCGCVCLRNAMPPAQALELGRTMLALADDPGPPTQGVIVPLDEVTGGFQRFHELLHCDRGFIKCCDHPTVVSVAHAIIGGRTEPVPNAFAVPKESQIRLFGMSGAVALPGNALGYWHSDGPMGQLSPDRPLPEHPTSIVCMWCLSEGGFSSDTGGTRLVPHSNQLRRVPPPTSDRLDGEACLVGGPGTSTDPY
jgi:hypothetical protein